MLSLPTGTYKVVGRVPAPNVLTFFASKRITRDTITNRIFIFSESLLSTQEVPFALSVNACWWVDRLAHWYSR
jgi:hypothetical protein